MSRKVAREVSLKLAFAILLGGENAYENILEQTGIHTPPQEEDVRFCEDIIQGVSAYQADLDAHIIQHAIDWSIERMPKVDLCILRIALYEMLYRDDISHSVSINEAVELAKRFGGEKSPAFINGLLGTVSQQLTQQTD